MMFGANLENLYQLNNAVTRSVSPENFTGEKGRGGMATEGTGAACAEGLGQGWKISPSVKINPGTIFTLADLIGPGCIQHIWMTPAGVAGRLTILRIYWEDSEIPSVECPLGDFFANAFVPEYQPVNSLAVCVNPRNGLNSYWQMPFRKRCRITIENLSKEVFTLYYQVDYALTELPDNVGYFHAQFRRSNPLPYKEVHTILDGVEGQGQYVGTYMTWGVHNNNWWGEGEIKFYMDGDREFPTICGTGTEDYFCGAYGFEHKGQYEAYSTPYAGFCVYQSQEVFSPQQRFSMYRWHILDAIRFQKDLRVTIQGLGWRMDGRYLPLQDDISSVALFYLDHPCEKMPQLPDKDFLEII